MEFNLKRGLNSTVQITVEEKDTAVAHGSGDLKVLATPAMIALMERASKYSLKPYLDEETTTVGIAIDIKHLKATPLGKKVKAEAILDKIDGKKLFFNIEAWDEKGKVGEGTHIRYIVNSKKFMEKLK